VVNPRGANFFTAPPLTIVLGSSEKNPAKNYLVDYLLVFSVYASFSDFGIADKRPGQPNSNITGGRSRIENRELRTEAQAASSSSILDPPASD
jgi:hypothetical protein